VAPLGTSFLNFLSLSIQPPTPVTLIPRRKCRCSLIYLRHTNKKKEEKIVAAKEEKVATIDEQILPLKCKIMYHPML